MKTRMMAVALLATALTIGFSNQASAHPWGRGHWCGPRVGVRVAVPLPQVIVGGGYYDGYAPAPYYGSCAPAPAPYYGGGYAYPRYREYRGGWGHRAYAYGGGYERREGYEHRGGGYERGGYGGGRGGYGGYGGHGGGYGPRGGGYGGGHRR